MKKKIWIVIVIILIFIIGFMVYRTYSQKENSNEAVEMVSKAQKIEIYDYTTNELVASYESKEEIQNVINQLEMEHWGIGDVPDEDAEQYIMRMYQEPTKQVLENPSNEMEEVANIVIYGSGEYVEFHTTGLEIPFKTNKNVINIFE